MIKSMTGFGKATVESGEKKVIIEVKSLNSKQLDINLRMPNLYKEKEMEIRNLIKNYLERGKVDVCIYSDNSESNKEVAINRDVVEQYFKQMEQIASSLNVPVDNSTFLQTIMRFPDVFKQKTEELNENEWEQLKAGIEVALTETDKFRIQEGDVLIRDILHRIDLIQEFASEVPQYEEKRIENIRQKLVEKIKEWHELQNVDQNRFEQEIIYYLEKLDITEEKVRLANHCKYFIETVEKEDAPGRKLGFIAQEIGREINTMGSKANNHDIQKLVVHMKDELEKIKEQSLNIL
ncbi:YicC/YloC family endoribonuclease [Odoribacter lunatus]|uniref:YicC/YloC family endoribonuclease n=1 Tax=Odoribacter lunatus TaxID=2941335 RepID=UPI00203BB34D|nr:YicC/YloC family endoribonuclease [Odoribacter lunatus]